jgi:hypothetical protein
MTGRGHRHRLAALACWHHREVVYCVAGRIGANKGGIELFRRWVCVGQTDVVTDEEPQVGAPTYKTARMEAFSDGVFAIAITLLVLEISVCPAGLGVTC